MCLSQIPEQPKFYCWNCAKYIEEKDVAIHDKLNHEIEEQKNADGN